MVIESIPIDNPILELLTQRIQGQSEEIVVYKTALEKSAAVSIANHEGIITYVNRKFCETTQYSRNELIGKTHQFLNSGTHSQEFFQNLWNTINQGNVWQSEVCNKAKDGSLYWVDTVIVPFRSARSKSLQFLSIRFNITERKRAEEIIRMSEMLLAKRNEELEQLNTEKNEFLGLVSHDLRNPLANITMLAQVLHENIVNLKQDEIYIMATKIESSAIKMARMIDKFLDINAIETIGVCPNNENVDCYKLVQAVVHQYRSEATVKGITIQVVPPDMDIIAYADEGFTTQILENLISNAVKYSFHDTTVTIRFASHAQRVLVFVRDEGPGFTEEDKTKLFRRFSHLSARPTGGEASTGLGLSVVKKLVESMRGRVWCESEHDKGAVFITELPAGRIDNS